MASGSPVNRAVMLLCYAAAGVLAAGAYQEYLVDAQRRAQGLFDPVGPLLLMQSLDQMPTTLAAQRMKVVIELSERRLKLYEGETLLDTYPVAVGHAAWRTPTGEFTVREMRRNPVWLHPITQMPVGPGPDNPLGTRWIGFSTLGQYRIGIHGTNEVGSIGEAVSHGCVRMMEPDIQALYSRIGLGTLIVVEP